MPRIVKNKYFWYGVVVGTVVGPLVVNRVAPSAASKLPS